MWNVILLVLSAMTLAGIFYLTTRVRKFTPFVRLAEKHKALSVLLALACVLTVGFFSFINLYSVVIVFLHLVIFWALFDLGFFIGRKIAKKERKRYIEGVCAILFTAVYLSVGWYNAHHVVETNFTVKSSKVDSPLRIVEIADSHLGITLDGRDFAKQLERINGAGPDVVVIVGDFVDDDTEKKDMLLACEALGKLKTKYGVYFVYGNHDDGYFSYRDFSSKELREALTSNGVVILEDSSVEITDGVVLVGRLDRTFGKRLDAPSLTKDIEKDKYIVMLDHQPNDYDAEEKSGADLVLSGHTHGGHIFPAGEIGLLIGANDRVYGSETRGGTTFFVTSGISGWGIPFKTFCKSEYVVIDVLPE